MSDEQFDDLKDLIQTTIANTESRLSKDIGKLRNEVKDGFNGVADTLEKTVIDRIDDHEARIDSLEVAA